MIKPKALSEGDTIGIVAPASPVEELASNQAKEAVRSLGFKVKMGESCFARHGYLAGNDLLRARDLEKMFLDSDVDGILCLRGGYGSARLIDYLDFDAIAKAPKIFAGYSDITALHIALQNRCGFVTFHAPMAASDFKEGIDKWSLKSFKECLMTSCKKRYLSNPPGEEIYTLVRGKAKGLLVGGNLAVICATLGTYDEIETKGRILFLEDTGEEPYRIDRMLTQLKQAGKLSDANGIVLGDWNNCRADGESLSLEEIFQEIIVPLDKPTIHNLKAGHCSPKISLPLGVEVTLDADIRTLMLEEEGTAA